MVQILAVAQIISRTFKNSKVISIEPDEDNFLLLSDNVKNQNAILINNAISNENFNFEDKR